MWRVIDSRNVAYEPYGKGIADIKRILRQKAGEGRFEGFGLLSIPPKGIFPKHVHPEREEIYYVLSGSGTLMMEEKEMAISEGALICISGEVSHGLSNSTNQPFSVMYVTAFV